ncbi:MAG: methyltransferase domain-containing protein [Candidatus Omnitrophota bacterium]
MIASSVLIKEKFSKASESYDELSVIQKEIADELLLSIKILNSTQRILDIGIGTGYLTKKIQSSNPNLQMYGLDLALGMLNKARQRIPNLSLIQADANYLPFEGPLFDLIVSNLTYQWVSNLEHAFKKVRGILRKNGRCYFSIFTENTLKELRQVISESRIPKSDPLAYLPDKFRVKDLFEKIGFKVTQINFKIKKQYYSNLLELLNWLKLIGANRYWSDRFYQGLSARNFIESISQKYEERFRYNDKIFATFEVLFVELIK